MTSGTNELTARHADLRKRCAAQRTAAARHLGAATLRLAGIDRGLQSLQRWSRSPVFIAAVIAVAAVIGRSGSLRGAGALLGLVSMGIKLRAFSQRVHRADSVRLV